MLQMGLNTRVKRLEQAQEPQRGYHLYSPAGAILEGAEVITRATPEAEGRARLADGKEVAVEWQGAAAMVFDADILTGVTGGKLRYDAITMFPSRKISVLRFGVGTFGNFCQNPLDFRPRNRKMMPKISASTYFRKFMIAAA
jgi:hypothetical protein